ncbi:MAG TPA: hypothetical protein VD999_07830 [Vitreimonas sp.]|nr:hypothetical protein [Vitreimonas sp.]
MKTSKIPFEKLSQIEKDSEGSISFETIDGRVTRIVFPGPTHPIIIAIDSYSVAVCQPAIKEVFVFRYIADVRGEKILIEKEFDSEHERERYISLNYSDVPEDEYSLFSATVLQD